MRYIIIILLLPIVSDAQFTYFNILNKRLTNQASATSVSYQKNPVNSDDNPDYEAFGFIEQTSDNQLTYFARSGTDHLTGGRPFHRSFNLSTGAWGAKVYWDSDTLDFRDVWGGKMDNDSIICFTSTSKNGAGGDWSSNIFYRKCDAATLTFSARVSIPITLERGTAFGKLTYMGSPGHYAIILNQYNINSPVSNRISVLTTNDYFNTYTEHIVSTSTTYYSEACVAYLGNQKFVVLSRAEQLGHIHCWQSSDSASTWTDKGATNLGWYTDKDKIPFLYQHDGLLDILITDRSSLCISISKDNDPATFFGSATLFNPEEIYFYNDAGSTSNPNLGYASEIKIAANKWMRCWSRETGATDANIWFTLDNETDISAPPTPVNIQNNFTGTNYFRLDIDDYDSHMKDVRYFQIDVSTDAGFASFISGQVNSASNPTVTIQNIRMKGPNVSIYGLTTGTTYYARVRAVNNAGSSSYYIKTITTL